MRTKKSFLGGVIAILTVSVSVVGGCGGPRPTESVLPTSSSPLVTPVQFESPLQVPDEVPGPAFAIDRPLEAGATRVTGQGPVGIPIVVVDVTLTGRELGQGFIDDSGHFDIELSEPLESGHRIGLMAGTAHPMSAEEIETYMAQLDRWKGEGARNLPYIGMLFDTVLVED